MAKIFGTSELKNNTYYRVAEDGLLHSIEGDLYENIKIGEYFCHLTKEDGSIAFILYQRTIVNDEKIFKSTDVDKYFGVLSIHALIQMGLMHHKKKMWRSSAVVFVITVVAYCSYDYVVHGNVLWWRILINTICALTAAILSYFGQKWIINKLTKTK